MVESLRILAVDDEVALLHMVKLFLTRQKHIVQAMSHAHEALAWFKVHSAEVDLVIIDLSMPEMPGEDLARAMFEVRPDIYILLSSGYPYDTDALPEKIRPYVGFLGKPYVPRELEAAIHALVG